MTNQASAEEAAVSDFENRTHSQRGFVDTDKENSVTTAGVPAETQSPGLQNKNHNC